MRWVQREARSSFPSAHAALAATGLHYLGVSVYQAIARPAGARPAGGADCAAAATDACARVGCAPGHSHPRPATRLRNTCAAAAYASVMLVAAYVGASRVWDCYHRCAIPPQRHAPRQTTQSHAPRATG